MIHCLISLQDCRKEKYLNKELQSHVDTSKRFVAITMAKAVL